MFVHGLENFIQQITTLPIQDEWYLEDFIEKHVDVLSTFEAYDASSLILESIKNDSRSDLLYELLRILKALQQQSDTTQLPLILITHPEILNAILDNITEPYVHELINELYQCYRM